MADLKHVKVGDRVVFGTYDYLRNAPRTLSIHTVTKVTPKKFKTAGDELYSKDSGKSDAGSDYMYHRIATAEECAQWDVEQAAKREQAKRAKVEQEAVRQKGVELYGLFPANLRPYLEMEDGAWDVTLRGLTEEEVRQLAEKVRM